MTVITIRNVPEDLNERLKSRARERGQSLQQFLLRELSDVAARSPLEARLREVLAGTRPHPVDPAAVLTALEAGRSDRDARTAEASFGADR